MSDLPARILPAIDFQTVLGLAATGQVGDLLPNAVAYTSGGDVVVAGSFQGTVNFDPSGNSGGNLTATGFRDGFLARYRRDGAFIWARRLAGAGGTDVSQVSGLVAGSDGSLTLAGSFSGTVDFDPGPTASNRSSPGKTDPFVLRLDASGNFSWVASASGPAGANSQAYAVAVNASGQAFVAGSFQGTTTFGSTTVNAGGFFDAFVARVGATGQFDWVRVSNGAATSSAEVRGLAVDPSGNLVAAGFLAGSATFGAAGLTSSSGTRDALVWKLDVSGSTLWARDFGGADFDQATSIAAAKNGDVLVAGSFSGSVDFSTSQTSPPLNGGSGFDPFVLRLTGAGDLAWARSFNGSSGSSQANGVVEDPLGSVFVAGTFQGAIDLDPGPLVASQTGQAGGFDAFVVQLGPTGTYLASRTGGGTGFDSVFGMAVDSSSNLAVTGTYSGPATFGTTTLPARPTRSIVLATLTQGLAPPAAPDTPVLQPSSNTGGGGPPYITSVTALTFDATGVSGSNRVDLLRNGQVAASRAGAGSVRDPGPVSDGTYTYTLIQTDSLGNASPASTAVSVRIKATAPASPGSISLLAADNSGLVGDRVTNVNRPRLTGVGEAGATVRLLNAAGSAIASSPIDGEGRFQLQWPSALADGNITARLQAIDAAGNLSPVDTSFQFAIDATPPPAPGVARLHTADDSGTAGDGLTNVARPRLLATAEPGSTVDLIGNGTRITSAVAGTDGTVSWILPQAFSDGTYSLTALATDAAGNASATSTAFSLRILATPPAAPPAPILVVADDSGTPGDNLTNVNRPRLSGTATPGLTIRLLNATSQILATSAVAQDGRYSIQPDSSLADGGQSLRVQVVDLAGNLSAPSPTLSLQIKATPPTVPSGLALDPRDDSGTTGDGITNQNRPRIRGTAQVGLTIELRDPQGSRIGTTTADASGAFVVAPDAGLADGSVILQVVAADAAGNRSPAATLTLRVLTTPPTPPTLTGLDAADDSGVTGDGITNVARPRLTGTALAGLAIQVRDADTGLTLASGVADGSGRFSIAPASNLSEKTYRLAAYATDVAGNTSAQGVTSSLTIRILPPSTPGAPALHASDDSGTKGDGLTNVARPRVVGQATANTTVILLETPSGRTLATGMSAPDGTYSLAPASSLADGAYTLAIRLVDVAGNQSQTGATTTITVRTAAPPALAGPTLNPADDSGAKGDAFTNINRPRLGGTAQPSAVVQLLDESGGVLGSTTADAIGAFQVVPGQPLPDGVRRLAVRQIDAAGNIGPAGTLVSITIKSQPPAAPGFSLLPADDTGVAGDGVTAIPVPRLALKGEPQSQVQILAPDGTTIGTAQLDSTGAGVATLTRKLAFGVNALRARVVDVAGNLGQPGTSLAIRVIRVIGDFDGDGKSDLILFRPTTAETIVRRSARGDQTTRAFGQARVDLPNPSDYDGDGRADVAIYRPSNGNMAWINSSNGQGNSFPVGNSTDTPIRGDFDGDGRDDPAVFRKSTATFLIRTSTTAQIRTVAFGLKNSDIPVPADIDGDGRTDIAVFRRSSSTFFWISSATGVTSSVAFGQPNLDMPAVADYDGDGKADLAVFRRTTSTFLIRQSTNGQGRAVQFGRGNSDLPLLGDFDGDGKADIAVFRPSTATFLILPSRSGILQTVQFGRGSSDQAALTPLWARGL